MGMERVEAWWFEPRAEFVEELVKNRGPLGVGASHKSQGFWGAYGHESVIHALLLADKSVVAPTVWRVEVRGDPTWRRYDLGESEPDGVVSVVGAERVYLARVDATAALKEFVWRCVHVLQPANWRVSKPILGRVRQPHPVFGKPRPLSWTWDAVAAVSAAAIRQDLVAAGCSEDQRPTPELRRAWNAGRKKAWDVMAPILEGLLLAEMGRGRSKERT